MNRPLLCLAAFALCACNPLPKTPDEEEKAEAAKTQAAATKATATPRKAGEWIYDNQKKRLDTNDRDTQGKPANPLKFSTPRKDGKYSNSLDKAAK